MDFGHDLIDNGTSDDYYTPPFIFESLDVEFDMDVCAPANGVPWFYVVSYEQSPSGGPGMLKQYYGEFGDANGSGNSPEYSNISSAVPVGTSFGKKVKRVNSEYTYLKNLR